MILLLSLEVWEDDEAPTPRANIAAMNVQSTQASVVASLVETACDSSRNAQVIDGATKRMVVCDVGGDQARFNVYQSAEELTLLINSGAFCLPNEITIQGPSWVALVADEEASLELWKRIGANDLNC